MNDLVERLQAWHDEGGSLTACEAADTIEALRKQVETWSIRAEAHRQACIASELALAAMTAERDELRQHHTDKQAMCIECEQQLADMTAERDDALRVTFDPKVLEQMNVMEKQLAASQASEAKLRETIAHHIKNRQLDDEHELCEALALPQDDTALKQYGAKLLRDAADRFGKGETPILPFELRRMADELEGKK